MQTILKEPVSKKPDKQAQKLLTNLVKQPV